MQTNWWPSPYLWRGVLGGPDFSPFGFYSIISRVVRRTPGNRSKPRFGLRFPSRPPRIASVPHRVAVTYEDVKKAGPYADALRLVGLEPVLLSANQPATLIASSPPAFMPSVATKLSPRENILASFIFAMKHPFSVSQRSAFLFSSINSLLAHSRERGALRDAKLFIALTQPINSSQVC